MITRADLTVMLLELGYRKITLTTYNLGRYYYIILNDYLSKYDKNDIIRMNNYQAEYGILKSELRKNKINHIINKSNFRYRIKLKIKKIFKWI